ncbi:MAG: RNA polymerase sigma factor [Ruminiclostridium sp.]
MSEAEFERLIGLYSGTVYRTAYCRTGNAADAEDIMQEAFLRLYTSKLIFENDEHIKAWLIRTAANLGKNLIKSGWYRFSEPITAETEGKPAKETESPEEGILPLIMKLKPKNRLALYMHYYEGYSVKEIAAVLGEKESAVTSRLLRARKQLKALIIKEGIYEL